MSPYWAAAHHSFPLYTHQTITELNQPGLALQVADKRGVWRPNPTLLLSGHSARQRATGGETRFTMFR